MRYRYRVASFVLVAVLGGAVVGLAETDGSLTGRVTSSVSPLSTVTVYAHQVAKLTTQKTVTDIEGGFLFEGLPAGLYKVIAYKPGFLPSVLMLRRATAGARQFLAVQLEQVPADAEAAALSFWEVREKIPTDVLREIDLATVDLTTPELEQELYRPTTHFEGQMAAIAGIEEGLDFDEAGVAGAVLGLNGRINDYMIQFNGRFAELDSTPISSLNEVDNPATGRSQQLSLSLQNKRRSQIDVTSRSNRLTTVQDGDPSEVDYEAHRVSWSRSIGRTGRSDVTARYTSENNFYRQALMLEPMGIPTASRSWQFEGSYSGNVTERSTIEAGMSYRERDTEFLGPQDGFAALLPRESVELFGRAGMAIKPAVVLRYGLYSTLRDGTLSLAPQGGVVLEFGPNWRASSSFSRRIEADPAEEQRRDFVPAYFGDGANCQAAEEYCYEVLLSRLLGNRQSVSFGATHRKIAETQRLYFSEDFFNRFDSLYLVEGDRLPELKVELTSRLAPAILTRLRSNIAAGGGGLFHSVGETPYQNNVRYLVTSLDTQFEDTMTGVFLAFHRLEQELEPLVAGAASPYGYHELELERLQLRLRQDLDILHQLTNDWAVQLNMELSRGGAGLSGYLDDELRRRVTGGLAVKF